MGIGSLGILFCLSIRYPCHPLPARRGGSPVRRSQAEEDPRLLNFSSMFTPDNLCLIRVNLWLISFYFDQIRQILREFRLDLIEIERAARLHDQFHDLLTEVTPAFEHGGDAFAARPCRRRICH